MKLIIPLMLVAFSGILTFSIYTHREKLAELSKAVVDYRTTTRKPLPQPRVRVPTPPESLLDIEKGTTQPGDVQPKIIYTEPDDVLPWGVAQKVDDVTYTIRVGYDENMTTPQELLDALNQYRSVHSRSGLAWDGTLANYAQERANHFESIRSTDKHAGFNTFLENEDGFNKLRFNRVGENSFFGGKLTGTHLIEWVFAKSPGHDANQLDAGWTHVGIGVTGSAVNLIFGSGQM